MERLRPQQNVILSLDEVPDTIQCRVLEVHGPLSRLSYQEELPPRAVGRLVMGSPGYVVFDEFRIAVGLRVAVRASPPYLDITIVDGVHVPERRGGERVKLVTRGRITIAEPADAEPADAEPADAEPAEAAPANAQPSDAPRADAEPAASQRRPLWTYTIDISESGALLRRHPSLEAVERFTLELMFGDDPQPVVAEAEIVRRTDDAVGVRFGSIASDGAKRLGGYLMGIRHQRRVSLRN
jgi:hypothetical protein